MSEQNTQMYDDEIDLIALVKTLFHYWKLIVSITATATIIAIIFAMLATPMFKSSAKFFIPQSDNSSMSGYMSAISSLGLGGMLGGDASSEIVLNLINSRRMARDIVNEFDLVNVYNSRVGNDKNKSVSAEQQVREMYNAVNQLKGSMSVNKDKTGLISLAVEDRDPQLAADIANFTIKNLDVINEELKVSSQKPLVTVLDAAEKPLQKSKPNKKMMVIIGFITGGMISVFLSFLLDYLKKNFNI